MNRFVGGMAKVRIEKKEGQTSIKNYEILPTVTHISKDSITTYFLSDYTEELAKENRVHRQDSGFSLEACKKLVEEVWGIKQ